MIKGMAHVGVNTTDLERSLRFYHETLGFPIVEDLTLESGLRLVFVQVGDGSMLELFGRPEPVAPIPQGQQAGPQHLAFVVDDIDAVYQALCARGVEFTSEPRFHAAVGKRLAFFKDPDGTVLELVQK